MSYYRQTHGIELTDYRVDYPWWEDGYPDSFYQDCWYECGCREFSGLPKPGDMVKLRVDLYEAFCDASLTCKGNSKPFNDAAQACATAPALDVMDLNYQLAKARYLNPTLSLADGVYHSADGVKVDACLVSYYALSAQCPDNFISFKQKYPEVEKSDVIKQCKSFWKNLF